MIKRQNGYFINPLAFKDFGGSDIFFVSVLEKIMNIKISHQVKLIL